MKRLIHSALLAIIAIGGAVSAHAITFYWNDLSVPTRTPLTCNGGSTACGTGVPSNAIFYTQASGGNTVSRSIVDLFFRS